MMFVRPICHVKHVSESCVDLQVVVPVHLFWFREQRNITINVMENGDGKKQELPTRDASAKGCYYIDFRFNQEWKDSTKLISAT